MPRIAIGFDPVKETPKLDQKRLEIGDGLASGLWLPEAGPVYGGNVARDGVRVQFRRGPLVQR